MLKLLSSGYFTAFIYLATHLQPLTRIEDFPRPPNSHYMQAYMDY